ncbi:MAG: fasciclin [Flaviaesturariibacter sp.]|nr:fasciclin [Flaviaesturariibacter sp.]
MYDDMLSHILKQEKKVFGIQEQYPFVYVAITNQLIKSMFKKISGFAIAATLCASLTACSDNSTSTTSTTNDSTTTVPADSMGATSTEAGVMVGGANMVPSKNIVENAAGSADHTTLVAAVTAAGLGETLSGAGPFTVFAPTNEAFKKLPAGTVDNLLKPEMKADLTSVLTYHVVPGALRAADLKDGQKLKTVQGKELTVSIKDGKVMIDGATVTIPDVISSNGVTHVIDAVVLPKK